MQMIVNILTGSKKNLLLNSIYGSNYRNYGWC